MSFCAAREKLGREYMTVVKQRKNIVTNIIRQAAGEMQLRINLHSVDTHPDVRMGRDGAGVVGWGRQWGVLAAAHQPAPSDAPRRQETLACLQGEKAILVDRLRADAIRHVGAVWRQASGADSSQRQLLCISCHTQARQEKARDTYN